MSHNAFSLPDVMAFKGSKFAVDNVALNSLKVSPDELVNQAFKQLCQTLGLKASSHEEIQKLVTIVSYAAISEIVAHSFGIAGFAKLDLTGK